MLSLPDFREKQILFIIPEHGGENKIRLWNDNIRFEVDGKIINQLSCSICNCTISDFLT